MTRLLTATALGLLIAATPVLAQGFGALDTNADGRLDAAEFRDAFARSGLFDRWDEDDDGILDAEEFGGAVYEAFDADDDGQLTVSEWDDAVDRWFGEEAVNLSVAVWDEDGDGVIGRAEFIEDLQRTDLFARFEPGDADGLIGEEDLSGGLFGLADADEDDALLEGEGILADLVDDGLFDGEPEETAATATPAADAQPGADDVVADPADEAVPASAIIEAGEAFTQLPIPCGEGGDAACSDMAARFCSALGYEPPIDSLAVDGQLYVIRCQDEL